DNVFNFGVEGDFSVAVWLKMPNPTGTTGLVTTLSTGAISGWGLVAFAGGNVQFELNPGGGARAVSSNAVALMNSAEWFHVAATNQGGNAAGNSTAALRLYINGQQVAANTVNFGGDYSTASYPDHDLHFGAYANLSRGLQGVLDGVRVYDHVLGVGEVQDLIPSVWNGGTGDWTDADKWSTAWAPGAGGGATIGSGGTPTISETATVGHVTVANGASLQLQGGITVTGLSLSLMGNGVANGGALRNLSGVNTWSGPITMQAGQTGRIGVDSGTLTLSGPITFSGSQTGGFLVVHGAGTLNITGDISGGTVGGESVATGGGLSGTLILSGNNSYVGYTRINAGTLSVAGGAAIPDASRVWFFNSGRLDLQANETVGSLDSAAIGTRVTLNANTLTVGGDDSNRSFAGVISGTGGLTKIGSGTQILTANNTYTGATTISDGTLRVDGNHIGGGLYTVAGGTLSGTGVIGATVNIGSGGVHAPGASVGEQTVGDAIWSPGGAFQFEINDAVGSPGIAWDRVLVTAGQNQAYGTGVLDISSLTAGSFQIDIMSLAGASPGSLANFIATEPRTWEFITFDSLMGTFDPDLFLLNTDGFTDYNNLGAGYFEIVQTATGLAVGFVPEPGTLAMAILGLACLLGRRRRK
ncbi:MAG: LamG-like jellyroll fold domain-containing protein, partial [Patescibacteria group bacterium]|nr:LamG-like jellyroll fold domain-containing protein [Patescibacteria group bacterium]